MTSRTLPPDVRSVLHDRFDALLDDSDQVMDNAAYGQTVHDLDDFLFDEGRKLLREVYEQKLQERIQRIESGEDAKQCPACKKKRTTKTRSRKT